MPQLFCLSDCLCVCWCDTCLLCIKILLSPDSPLILAFHHRGSLLSSDGFTPNQGTKCKGGEKNGRFLTDKSVYIRNGARYSHCCYRSRIGNHNQATEWWHFQWPSVTPMPSFKVTIQFEGKYLANGACYGHSYYRTRIGSHTRATKWWHFWWPWVILPPVLRSPDSSKANISQTWCHAGLSTMYGVWSGGYQAKR